MKRLFYIVMIMSCILLGTCVSNVSARENRSEQAQLLTSLGVLDSEILKEDAQEVTRGQFIIAAMRMLGYDDETLSAANAQLFYDVPSDHKAAGAVGAAYVHGIISGLGSKMFAPEEPVTYEQALKIMVGVLGWTKLGGNDDIQWCVNKAGELGIMNGISQTITAPLTKESMITLLYNCLDCDALVVDSFGAGKVTTETSNLLYTSFNAVKVNGTVTANALTGLKGEGTRQADEVEIDGERYYCGDIDAGKYLGYSVTIYYVEGETGELPRLLFIKDRNTEITEIKARDLESFRGGTYTYTKENGATAKLKVSQSADIIYNGKSPVNVNDEMYMPKAGSIRVLTRSGSSSADVIFIEDYYNMFVYNINQQDRILYDKYDSSKRLDLDSDVNQPDVEVVYDSGDAADFSSIKKDSLISIMKSDDGEYIKIVINTNKIAGTMSVVSDDKLTMDGTEYDISPLFDTALQPKISSGDKGTLYLDMNGEAAVFTTESSGSYEFGFIINAWIPDGGEAVGVKILTAAGEINKYDVKIPVSIDGSSVKSAEKIIARLSAKNGALERQVLRYTLNEDGMVNKIDLPYTTEPASNETKNTLHLEYDSGTAEYEYKSYAATFSGKVNIDDNTVIFSVPEEKDSDDMYTVEKPSYFVNDESYRIKSYMLEDDDVIADAVVVVKGDSDAISDQATLGLVNKIYTGVTPDGEIGTIISVYNDGVLKELPIVNDSLIRDPKIESGDAIRFALNNKGEINILEQTYDYSLDRMINSESHNNRTYNSKFKLVKGGLYNKSGKVLMVAPLEKMGSSVRDDYTKYTLVSFSKIYIYDSDIRKGNKASIGTEADLIDYLHAGEDYSKLFIRTEYAQPRDIIIYK